MAEPRRVKSDGDSTGNYSLPQVRTATAHVPAPAAPAAPDLLPTKDAPPRSGRSRRRDRLDVYFVGAVTGITFRTNAAGAIEVEAVHQASVSPALASPALAEVRAGMILTRIDGLPCGTESMNRMARETEGHVLTFEPGATADVSSFPASSSPASPASSSGGGSPARVLFPGGSILPAVELELLELGPAHTRHRSKKRCRFSALCCASRDG
mgnify:CR=1 FL=1